MAAPARPHTPRRWGCIWASALAEQLTLGRPSLVGETAWRPRGGTFARQALPMVWDFTEANSFSSSSGNWLGACLNWVAEALDLLPLNQHGLGIQADATRQAIASMALVSTDPPYYDNIGYADLSDFFYVWLRRSLRSVFPDLFATLAVPKAEELVATTLSPWKQGKS